MTRKKGISRFLVNPERVLVSLGLQPGEEYRGQTVIKCIVLANVGLFGLGQLIHQFLERSSIVQMAQVGTIMMNVLQGFFKLCLLYAHWAKLASMLRLRRRYFWPHDLFGGMETHLDRLFVYAGALTTYEFCIGINYYGFMFLGPLLRKWSSKDGAKHKRELAVPFWLPFDASQSPWFELIYVWEAFSAVYVTMMALVGVDFLFITMKARCIAQFRMLKYALSSIGTERQKGVLSAIERFDGARRTYKSEEFRLLVACVEKHQILLDFCQDVEKVFTSAIFFQYFFSCFSICISAFLANLLTEAEKLNIMILVVGYLGQLLIFCSFGNELRYQSSRIFEAASNNGWYQKLDDKTLAHGICMVRFRALRECKLTAFGFASLDFVTYIKILRLSFSFYTLLKYISE